MKFNNSQDDFRNLILKLFSRSFFNQNTPIEGQLKNNFFHVLKSAYLRTCHHFYLPVLDETLQNLDQLKLEAENSSIKVDLNEDEDILIKTARNIVVIHAIYKQKWQFETDVKERMDLQLEQMGGRNAIQVLTVSKEIWEDSKKHTEEMIHYKRLRNYLRHDQRGKDPFIVLFWEDILDFLEEREGDNPAYLSLKKILETP